MFKDSSSHQHPSELFVSVKSCFYKRLYVHSKKVTPFRLSQADLVHLYEVIVSNKFDRIECVQKIPVSERKGVVLIVIANGKTYQKADIGHSFLQEGFSEISFGFTRFAMNEIVRKYQLDTP